MKTFVIRAWAADDPMSVMHYLGPGVGDPKLEFTEHDRTGAVRVYGHPDADFHFVV